MTYSQKAQTMAPFDFQARIQKIADELSREGIDAYFAWSPTSLGYLQGFHEYAAERFLLLAIRCNGQTRLICPKLSALQAERSGIKEIRAWSDNEDPLQLFGDLASDWSLRSAVVAVDDTLPAKMLLDIQSALPAALFRVGGPLLSRLTRVKDAEEIARMRRAAQIADEAFKNVLSCLGPGISELEVCQYLYDGMRALGGEPTFAIVATGVNSAEPHHMSDQTILKPGDVVSLDFGCSFEGYQSDITRMVCLGKASDKAKEIYQIVLAAHQKAREAIRPGVACEAIDEAARQVIERAGYGPQFIHRTGHGIGMSLHEEPNIVHGNTLPLEPGHCFSIEPGIYLPGEFGVRIENIVTVTDQGEMSLNEEPAQELMELC